MVSTTLNMTGEMASAGVARTRTAQCTNAAGWSIVAGAKFFSDMATHPITRPTARGPS